MKEEDILYEKLKALAGANKIKEKMTTEEDYENPEYRKILGELLEGDEAFYMQRTYITPIFRHRVDNRIKTFSKTYDLALYDNLDKFLKTKNTDELVDIFMNVPFIESPEMAAFLKKNKAYQRLAQFHKNLTEIKKRAEGMSLEDIRKTMAAEDPITAKTAPKEELVYVKKSWVESEVVRWRNYLAGELEKLKKELK